MTIIIHFFTSSTYAGTFVVDPTYSTIHHRIRHLMGYNIGTFDKFDGKIEFDKNNEKLKRVEFTVDVTTVNTHNPMRDAHLRSQDLFYIEKFPQATFRSSKITDDKITGVLTLRGVKKEIEVSYFYWGTGKDQFGRTKVALTLQGIINRQDFGIVYNEKVDGGYLLGDEVEIFAELQGLDSAAAKK